MTRSPEIDPRVAALFDRVPIGSDGEFASLSAGLRRLGGSGFWTRCQLRLELIACHEARSARADGRPDPLDGRILVIERLASESHRNTKRSLLWTESMFRRRHRTSGFSLSMIPKDGGRR